MRQVAAGVWLLTGFPHDLFNVYLAEDVLIDGGTRWAKTRILRQIEGRPVRLMALTHCHPDHQGVAQLVCKRFGIPLACHELDVLAMEGRAPMVPDSWVMRLQGPLWAGPPHPVGRVLREGDEVAGFRVLHMPGHTPGHVVYFRDADRVAIIGDLMLHLGGRLGRPTLLQPATLFTVDPAQNRRSIRRLAELRPALLLFGHGPPLRDPDVFQRFAAELSLGRGPAAGPQ
jgi:glyoxylase-like metal-dependent hydrolase (beta-lactamase superfamily II)